MVDRIRSKTVMLFDSQIDAVELKAKNENKSFALALRECIDLGLKGGL